MIFFKTGKFKQLNSIKSSYLIVAILALCSGNLIAQPYNLPQQNDRWTITPDGAIEWKIDSRLPHQDHIEMSAEKVSLWMQYGVDTGGKSNFVRTIVFPTFRLLPQRTVAHMTFSGRSLATAALKTPAFSKRSLISILGRSPSLTL